MAAPLILALVVAAFAIRVVAVPVLRPHHQEAAAWVERHWTWLPMLAFVVLVTLWSWVAGLLLGGLAAVIIARPGLLGLPPYTR